MYISRPKLWLQLAPNAPRFWQSTPVFALLIVAPPAIVVTPPANLCSCDLPLQGLQPNHLARASWFDVPRFPTSPPKLEKLYNWLKCTPDVSRILFPLSLIGSPNSLVPSGVKWMKEEWEIRWHRVVASLDTSAFARRAGDRCCGT